MSSSEFMSLASLRQQRAFQDLEEGCDEIGLHRDAALDLVAFLRVKRQLSTKESAMSVSPGTKVDELWHWMLLNSQVAHRVHQLIGGEVEHKTKDAFILDDNEKMLRRLHAINLMALNGFQPNLQFWQQPGTLLALIYTVEHDGAPLYISNGCSSDQQLQLVAALQGTDEGIQQERITGEVLFVKLLTGKTITMPFSPKLLVEEVKQFVLDHEGIPLQQQRFIYHGRQLEEGKTLGSMEGKTLQLVSRLKGC